MFTRMDHSTEEEWQHISEKHMPHIFDMPKRIISSDSLWFRTVFVSLSEEPETVEITNKTDSLPFLTT